MGNHRAVHSSHIASDITQHGRCSGTPDSPVENPASVNGEKSDTYQAGGTSHRPKGITAGITEGITRQIPEKVSPTDSRNLLREKGLQSGRYRIRICDLCGVNTAL